MDSTARIHPKARRPFLITATYVATAISWGRQQCSETGHSGVQGEVELWAVCQRITCRPQLTTVNHMLVKL